METVFNVSKKTLKLVIYVLNPGNRGNPTFVYVNRFETVKSQFTVVKNGFRNGKKGVKKLRRENYYDG